MAKGGGDAELLDIQRDYGWNGLIEPDSKKRYWDTSTKRFTDKKSRWTVDASEFKSQGIPPTGKHLLSGGMNRDLNDALLINAYRDNSEDLWKSKLNSLFDDYHPWSNGEDNFDPVDFFPKDRTFFGNNQEGDGSGNGPTVGGGLASIPTPRLIGSGGIPSLSAKPVNTGLVGGPTSYNPSGMFNDGGMVANGGYGNGGYAGGAQYTQPIAPPNGPPGGQFNPITQASTPPAGAQPAGGAGNWSNPTMFATGFDDGGEVKAPPKVRGYKKKKAVYEGGARDKVTYQSAMAKMKEQEAAKAVAAKAAPTPPPAIAALLGSGGLNLQKNNKMGNVNMFTQGNGFMNPMAPAPGGIASLGGQTNWKPPVVGTPVPGGTTSGAVNHGLQVTAPGVPTPAPKPPAGPPPGYYRPNPTPPVYGGPTPAPPPPQNVPPGYYRPSPTPPVYGGPTPAPNPPARSNPMAPAPRPPMGGGQYNPMAPAPKPPMFSGGKYNPIAKAPVRSGIGAFNNSGMFG